MRRIPGPLLIIGLAAGSLSADDGFVYKFEMTCNGQRVQTTKWMAADRNLKIENPGEFPAEFPDPGKPVPGGLVTAPATVDITDGTVIEGHAWTCSEGLGGGAVIYRGNRRELVIVDPRDETYTVIDQKAIESVAGQVGATRVQVQKALENVPESQRAAIEKMMKERMPQAAPAPPLGEVRHTGEKGVEAGYPCVKHEVARDGVVVRELWVTDWDNLEGGAEMRQLFEEMAAFFGRMMDAFASAAGAAGGMGGMGRMVGGRDRSMFELFDEIDGFPVVTRDLAPDGSLKAESTLGSAEPQDVDPEAFKPPVRYKRTEMFRE